MNINNLPKIPSLEEVMRETGLNETLKQNNLNVSSELECPILRRKSKDGRIDVLKNGEVVCEYYKTGDRWYHRNKKGYVITGGPLKKYCLCLIAKTLNGSSLPGCKYSKLPGFEDIKEVIV
ncbi:MAG: hypothetical protein ACP5OG_00775 [Candidatus Nanoarchaeia archaeon]